MRKFALTLIIMLASTLYAQNNTIVLDGIVQDDKNRPISNATIIISSKTTTRPRFRLYPIKKANLR